jgi:hypothetical protein
MRRAFLHWPRTSAELSADVVRLLAVLSVIAGAIWWTPTDAGILAFALPATLLPRFLGVRPAFDITYGVTILVAAWSNVLDLYTSIAWWDLAVHFVATGVVAAMLCVLLSRWGVVPWQPETRAMRRVPLLVVPVLALAISALWEMVEWFGHTFISDDIFVAYADTIGDMAVGGLGGVVAGIVIAFVPVGARATVSIGDR